MVLLDSESLVTLVWVGAICIFLAAGAVTYTIRRSGRQATSANKSLEAELGRLRSDHTVAESDERELRSQATAEALRREPELAERMDPESLKRLRDLVAEISAEIQIRQDVERIKAQQLRESQLTEAQRSAARLREEHLRREAEQLSQTEHLFVGMAEGFYVDPLNANRERYWDGRRWDYVTYPKGKRTKRPQAPS